MPPVAGWRRHERVEWLLWREAVEVGVMLSRKGAAPGPERRCCTLGAIPSIVFARVTREKGKHTCAPRQIDSLSPVSICDFRPHLGLCIGRALRNLRRRPSCLHD
jgi:hypothetical protein